MYIEKERKKGERKVGSVGKVLHLTLLLVLHWLLLVSLVSLSHHRFFLNILNICLPNLHGLSWRLLWGPIYWWSNIWIRLSSLSSFLYPPGLSLSRALSLSLSPSFSVSELLMGEVDSSTLLSLPPADKSRVSLSVCLSVCLYQCVSVCVYASESVHACMHA